LGRSEKQSFIEGAMILTAATGAVKILGALFKIPIANILGGVGMSYFTAAYEIFNPIYAVTVTGLSVALSRMIASLSVCGTHLARQEAVNTAKRVFISVGAVGFILLLAFALPFSHMINNPGALAAIFAIAPAVIFTCITAVYRGYYQGMCNMRPTALSQICEAVVKLVFGTALSYLTVIVLENEFIRTGTVMGRAFADIQSAGLYILRFAAAAAIFGISLSTAGGCFYLSRRYRRERIKNLQYAQSGGYHKTKYSPRLASELIKGAVPISLSALVINITSLIDLTSVMNCLRKATETNSAIIFSIYDGLIPAEVTAELVPEYLYGSYSGLALSIFNLVPALTAAIGVSALPAVTNARSSGSGEAFGETVSSVLRITMLIALPAGLGIFVLAGPLLELLFPARYMEAAIITPVLKVMGISTVFVAAASPINSILQSIGKEIVPLYLISAGALLKLITNYMLVSDPTVNIRGVPYGTLLCYCFIVAVSVWVMIRSTGMRLSAVSIFFKPLLCAMLSSGAAYSCYYLTSELLPNGLKTVAAVGLAALVYTAAVLLTRTVNRTDINMLPLNKKIIDTLEKHNLIC